MNITNQIRQSAEDNKLLSMLSGVDTAAVSDAMDKLGLHGQIQGLNLLDNYPSDVYANVIIGPAFTVKYVPVADPAGSVGDFIDSVAEGDILVLDNDARIDCTVWGDIMTQYAVMRGIAGTVINGVCRDIHCALQSKYPVFSAGRFMRTGKDRVEVLAINDAISVGGVRIASRDFIIADANGVVAVPRHQVPRVAQLAHEISDVEANIRAQISQGKSLAEARRNTGYHSLQSKAK